MRLFITVIAIFASGGLVNYILAGDGSVTSTAENIPPWALGTGLVSGIVGGPLFAVWFSWYMTTKRVPAMERRWGDQITATEERHAAIIKAASERHAVQVEANEKRHADHVSLLIKDFREDLKELWKYKREDEIRLIETIQKLDGSLEALMNEVKQNRCAYEKSNHGP